MNGNNGQPETTPSPDTGPETARQHAPENAAANDTAAPVQSPELEALKAEAADLKDRLLRAHAEMENIRKRLEKEKQDAHKYAISKFARDIVNVGDNFQRAIALVPTAAVEQTPALKSLLEGVTMTEREFLNVLERNGIKRVDPLNEPFNPHLHQAVSEMERPDVPSGTVVMVYQAGYTIEDRVLRPAMVVVGKGGSKSQAAPQPATDAPAAPSSDGGPA